VTKVVKF